MKKNAGDKTGVVLQSPLDGLVGVGSCKDEEIKMDELKTAYKQLNAWVNGFQEQFADFRATMETTLKYMQKEIHETREDVAATRKLANTTYGKVTNGLTDSVITLKQQMKETVGMQEFNRAMASMRKDVEEAEREAKSSELAIRKFMLVYIGSFIGILGTAFALFKMLI